ncbi:MAG: hypothetical protein QOD75_362 [Blastocatellia bacterium]|jgi:hypothetical protein|nr:hypothetical protein [Blastocatellia bacterium]
MTRNEKIALGCGIASVIGILVLIGVCVVAFFVWRDQRPVTRSVRNYNFNSNSNSNRNSNSGPDGPTASSNMTEDERHRLFQAASTTGDSEILSDVGKKLGLMEPDGTPNSNYWKFTAKHMAWAIRDSEFLSSINTPEKARAYVDAHMND